VGTDSVAGFLHCLANVIHAGFPFEYAHRLIRTSILSGSLDIGRTIREFDSIGIRHRAVVRQTRRKPNQSLMAIIHAALGVLADEGLLASEEAAIVDTLTDALPALTDVVTRQEALGLIEHLEAEERDRVDIRMLCESARAILARGTSQEDIEYASNEVSFTFTDSDALWERAVHACLRESALQIGWNTQLHPKRNMKSPLYLDGGPNIDPDVIVYGDDGQPRSVVDAKDYATSGPDAGGVYQVDSYARHLRVRNAALFYLAAAEEWKESFGDVAVRVWSFGISPNGCSALQRLRVACSSFIAASAESYE
jgi:hypothetical protein